MTYQKNKSMHLFIETEPIPSREELISTINQKSYELTYGKMAEDYRRHPVRAAIGIIYVLAAFVLFFLFCIKGNAFGISCSVCMLAALFISSPFTPGYTHKRIGLLRVIAVLSALLLLGITACIGLSQFGLYDIPLPELHDPTLIVWGVLLLVVLFIPFTIMVFLIVNGIAERRCTEEVSATCIGYDCHLIVSRGRHHRRRILRYTPVYRYCTYEGEQTAVSKAATEDPASLPYIGETRSIWYNPRKHDEIRITEKPTVSWGIVAALAIVIILFTGLVVGIASQAEVTPSSSPTQTEDGRTILTDSYLNQIAGSEAWRIALRTVVKVENADGELIIYFEELDGFGTGIAIPKEYKAEYLFVREGHQMYWIQGVQATVVYSTATYVYEGNKTVVTE